MPTNIVTPATMIEIKPMTGLSMTLLNQVSLWPLKALEAIKADCMNCITWVRP